VFFAFASAFDFAFASAAVALSVFDFVLKSVSKYGVVSYKTKSFFDVVSCGSVSVFESSETQWFLLVRFFHNHFQYVIIFQTFSKW